MIVRRSKDKMRGSKYWDRMPERVNATVHHLLNGTPLSIYRVAVFVTGACNLKCTYCNGWHTATMTEEIFLHILASHSDALFHITGGEPTIVPWLYPAIEKAKKNNPNISIRLNTNAVNTPNLEYIDYVKISLDSHDPLQWDALVGAPGAHALVVKNIKSSISKRPTTVTCTITHGNVQDTLLFAEYCAREFPDLYALSFSIYKGNNPKFILTEDDVSVFFHNSAPALLRHPYTLNDESKTLLREMLDNEFRVMTGVRFPENNDGEPCYMSLSERTYTPDGREVLCGLLYRDKVLLNTPIKRHECLYGCNSRFVKFNEDIKRLLKTS